MTDNRSRDWLPPGIGLSLLILYSFGVLGHDLWTPDEPRVAALAREVQEGAWVVPTLNGSPFLEQPPLHAWCVALVYLAFGREPPEIGRIVSAAFGLGGIAITYLLGAYLARRLGHDGSARRVGLLGALTLGLSLEYLETAHRVVVDGALAFFTTLGAYGVIRGLLEEKSRVRTGWLAIGYAATSLAFLAKGAIGIAVPALAFLAVLIVLRRPRLALEARLWLAPIVFAAVAGPWMCLLGRQMGWDGFREIFLANTLGRVVQLEEVRSHARPIYYYAILLPVAVLPGGLFTLGAVLRRLRRRAEIPEPERIACDLGLVWFLLGFVMLSLATTKRGVYLVPLLPALALPGGFWLDAYLRGAGDGFGRGLGWILAAMLVLASIALPLSGLFVDDVDARGTVVGGLIGGATAAETLILARRGVRPGVLLGALHGIALVFLFAVAFVVPPVDALKTLGPSAMRISAAVPPGSAIYALAPDETTEGMIPFYTGRQLHTLDDGEALEDRLRSARVLYLLDLGKRWDRHGKPIWSSRRFVDLEDGVSVLEGGRRSREEDLKKEADGPGAARRIAGATAEVVLVDADRGVGSRAFRLVRIRMSG